MSQITSFKTREVRWFSKDPLPEISSWFEELPSGEYTRESREDVYLLLPGRDDLGVKFRGNRLELKYRLEALPPGELVPGIFGSVESWEKLGFPPDPEMTTPGLPGDSGVFRVPVFKKRVATLIETTGETEKFHPLGTPLPAFVQIEYTVLRVIGFDWYTIGLEWPDDKEIILPESLLSHLLAPVAPDLTSAMGYPEFLQGVVRPKERP